MAKFLQRLLDAREPLFSTGLNQLEIASGRSGVDVRLIADITHASHRIMRSLGLDPADSSAREFYQALNASVANGRADELLINDDYVLMSLHDETISCNLIDVIENAHHQLSFEERSKRACAGKSSLDTLSMSGPMAKRRVQLPKAQDYYPRVTQYLRVLTQLERHVKMIARPHHILCQLVIL